MPRMIRLSENSSSPVLEALASAFMDDPMYEFLLPEKSTRKEKLKAWFDFARRFYLQNGCVVTTSLHYEEVAMWIKSENNKNFEAFFINNTVFACQFAK